MEIRNGLSNSRFKLPFAHIHCQTEKIKVSDESSMICDVKIVAGKLQNVAVKTLPQRERGVDSS